MFFATQNPTCVARVLLRKTIAEHGSLAKLCSTYS